ncbi:putative esterase E4-like [Penaeus vannamei]|uniref:Putative esterase E4-like n=1 Tax=Penaeus vannamei TaxID=6689 RepID=A0A3R7N3A1_PENVA|nr:putative esterase E4-like [Penaeus vannamei]
MAAIPKTMLLWAAVLLWRGRVLAQSEAAEVQLIQGRISGAREEAGGRSFYAFRGIPYAQPPVGELRFQDPVAAEAWAGVRDGSTAPPLCPQLTAVDGETAVAGEEDCLYLSVYTSRKR